LNFICSIVNSSSSKSESGKALALDRRDLLLLRVLVLTLNWPCPGDGVSWRGSSRKLCLELPLDLLEPAGDRIIVSLALFSLAEEFPEDYAFA